MINLMKDSFKKYIFFAFFVAFVVYTACVNNYFSSMMTKTGREGFGTQSLNPKNYNSSDLLLANVYEPNQPFPEISHETYTRQSRKYPIFPASSKYSNNIEHWETPNNGKCVFPELCGAFYMNNS